MSPFVRPFPLHNNLQRIFRRAREYLAYLLRRAGDDRIAQVAGSLTYTTLLSLVPFVTIALGLFAAFPLFDELRSAIEEFMLDNLLPEEVADAVTRNIAEFSQRAAKLTAAGVIALGITAVMMMSTIDHAFNAIWRVPRPRPLLQRVLIYWAAVSLGPVLIGGGLVMTSFVVKFSLGWLPGAQWVEHAVLSLVPLMLTTAAFTLLYVAVPNRDVDLRHAFIGGLAAAIGFECMKLLFGFYISRFPTYTLIYGAFAAIPIFLLWVFLSWMVTLLGALVAATLPLLRYERAPMRRAPGTWFVDALAVLRLLHKHQAGGGITPRQVRMALKSGFEDTESLLDRLAAAGWAARVESNSVQAMKAGFLGFSRDDRWVLTCDPRVLTLADVYRLFAFDPAAAERHFEDGRVEEMRVRAAIADIGQMADAQLSMTLDDLFAAPTPAAATAPDAPNAPAQLVTDSSANAVPNPTSSPPATS